MIVLLLQGAVRARSSAFEPGRLTEVCIRNNQDSVARIPTQSRIEGAGIEAGDLVLPAVWIAQQRPAEAILQSHIAANLPGIPEVRLNIVPTSHGERIGLELTEAPLSASPKRVEYAVAGSPVAHAPELRVFGRGCVDQLILLVSNNQKNELVNASSPQNCAFSAEDALTSSFFWLLLTRKPTLKVWTPTTLEKSSFRTASCSLLCHGAMFQMLSELAPGPRPPQKTG